MSRRKVVTLCGSVRFWDKIQEMYEKFIGCYFCY